jgi:hypothetical protein
MHDEDTQLTDARAATDSTSTRIISRESVCDGVQFSWWSVGERPSLVTVSSPVFGSKNGFTDADPEAFAMELMRKLLPKGAPKTERRQSDGNSDPLTKPGWFERS